MKKFSGNKWRERYKLVHDTRYNYSTGKCNDKLVWVPIRRITKPNKGGHTKNHIINKLKHYMLDKGTARQRKILQGVFGGRDKE